MKNLFLTSRTAKGAVAAAALTLVAGCGSSGGSSPIAGAVQALKNTNIQGTSTSACTKADGAFALLNMSQKRSIQLIGNDVKITTLLYAPTDTGCGSPSATVTEKGTFSSDGSSSGGSNINFDLKSISITPNTPAGAVILNGPPKFCGIKDDYSAGKETPIPEGATSDSPTVHCFNKIPRTIFDVFVQEGNTMYFGKGSLVDKTDANKRKSLQVDRSAPYTYSR